MRVFNLSARSNNEFSLQFTYRQHEQEKRRQCNQRLHEVEYVTFTPLVLSCTGGLVRAKINILQKIASLLCKKKRHLYHNKTMI